MTEHRITEIAEPAEAQRQAILEALVAFSDPRAGAGDWPEHDLCLAIPDAEGRVIGGLWGRFYYDWLFIELISVPEALRGQKLGSALLAMAEAQAREWGAVGVWLDTFSFQARGFYEKKGYRVFGEIRDYPPPHKRFFLSRLLDPTGPARVVHPAIRPVAAPDGHERDAIGEALSRFNDAAMGQGVWQDRLHCLTLTDETGRITGGLWGRSYYRWLHVDLLFVPEAARGLGLGRELLRRAEEAARAAGCVGVWLDTFSFQAPDYYPRLGYKAFGQLSAYPGTHSRTFFSKRLDRG